ncbi:MAG TPA: sugar ABC transporter ATP-binding protein [Anaerolineae bacterium]|nr:sugar ABC transporter ATP-binding protein [Anaerolineae bacterium]
MKGISKAFPGVQALDSVDFDLYPGEVHVLVGENGAGKSTLMKILAGAYERDAGEIIIDGEVQTRWGPAIARAKGVAMVYQEFTLVPYRSVMENIFLGREKLRGGIFLDKTAMHKEAYALLESFGVPMDTHTPVIELSVAQQQMVEIAKALSLEARILVLDEPTSALTVRECEQLFDAIRRLKQRGVGIIYISHRLEEMWVIGDRVTVLQDGRLIGTRQVADVSVKEIVRMMVGQEIEEMFPRHYCKPGDVALRVEGLCTRDKLRDVTFEVRYGEIVGLFGLMGAGRTETARAIFGLDPYVAGTIEIMGKRVHHIDPPKAMDMGMGLLPEDRKRDGLFPILPLKSNIVMASLQKLFPNGILTPRKERRKAKEYVEKLRVQPPDLERRVRYFSGGNQQKIVIGKWLAMGPKVFIFDEPTRGIDVGAKAEVHAFMDQLANEGNAILMISSELPEIMGMSDRIYVMYDGAIVAEFPRGATAEEILRCAMGVKS